MIKSRVAAYVGAAFVIALAGGISQEAVAADLGAYGNASVKDIPPPPPSGRAVYLRGTIGMSTYQTEMNNEVYANGNFDNIRSSLKSGAFYGIGVGVETNRWLRLDITGEYRGDGAFRGGDRYYTHPCSTPGNCGTNEFNGDIESWVGLVNAYVDLGTWRGITPYVGGGVGVASVSVNGLSDVNVPTGGVALAQDHTDMNFAWALYAGVSFDVSQQVTMDLGYRYLDMGTAKSGPVCDYLGNYLYSGQEIDLTSHDLMATVRYRLDSPAPMYALK